MRSANIDDDSIVAIASTANHGTPNIFNASNLKQRRLIYG
jgi:hypothetical protein